MFSRKNYSQQTCSKKSFIFSIINLLLISYNVKAFDEGSSFSIDQIKAIPHVKLDSQTTITNIALGSCFAPQLGDDIFKTVNSTNPELFLFVGDNVYQEQETNDFNLPTLKKAYNDLAHSENFVSLAASTPIIATWDDHDFGYNDAGGSWPPKFNSETLFEHVWGLPTNDVRRSRSGIYTSQIVGKAEKRLQIIALDTRFFRTDLIKGAKGQPKYLENANSEATILGAEQWSWLEQELNKQADLTLLVSSVQVLSKNTSYEGWWQFPKDKEKLLNLITNRNNLIILSGDRHFSALYKLERDNSRPLFEYTSSSMNLPISGKLRTKMENNVEQYQIGKGIFDPNFASLQIDWLNKTMSVSAISSTGEPLDKQLIDFTNK